MKAKQILLTLVVLCLSATTLSAKPLSKKEYLRRYEKLITNIENDYTTCSDKEWERYEELFKRYSKQYYTKFKEELTKEELNRVNDWKASFLYIRTKRGVTGFIDNTKEYVESGELKRDFDNVVDEAGNTINIIGKTAKKAIEDLE